MPVLERLDELPGLGRKTREKLAAAQIYTAQDLLHIAPHFVHNERGDWQAGARIACRAQVLDIRLQFIRRRGAMLTLKLLTANGRQVQARFFNAAWMKKHFQTDAWYHFEGTLDKKRGDTLVMPSFSALDSHAAGSARHYPHCPPGISSQRLQSWIQQLLTSGYRCSDPLAACDDATYNGWLHTLHCSDDAQAFTEARRALALRDITALLWRLRLQKQQRLQQTARPLATDTGVLHQARSQLPYTLSQWQEQALQQLSEQLQQPHPARLMLQGDVGSGKSALAFICAWMALHNGCDVIYMAPTTLLAHQQQAFFAALLEGSTWNCQLLNAEHRPATVSSGPRCIIGTHALLHQPPQTDKAGLIIIDEQHKFGVAQRQLLLDTYTCEQSPHVLMLSATPIPRSLAHCVFGDLDLVNIKQRPQAHITLSTSLHQQQGLASLLPLINEHQQVNGLLLIVCPHLESEQPGTVSARTVYTFLKQHMPGKRIAQMHGSLRDDEQQELQQQIEQHQIDMLVSTSVIEVGWNVTHATAMLICNSERFGLAQLHQMRGRLARGKQGGHCCLLTPDPKQEQRLAMLVDCDDGFAIAEADLQCRGSGELLGQRQHGQASLYCADLNQDNDLIAEGLQIIDDWSAPPQRQLFTQA